MPSPDVYQRDAFEARVNFVTGIISHRRATSREFDSCLTMDDGEVVLASLMRRAKANPGGALSLNLRAYIGVAFALEAYEKTKHLSNRGMSVYAARLRDKADKVRAAREVSFDAYSSEASRAVVP